MKAIVLPPKPKELLLLESLSKRKKLSAEENRYFLNLKKGHEGELLFTDLASKTEGDRLVLNNLLIEHNQTTFQIDCLILTETRIFLYEVKNFEGDFYLEGDKFYKKPRRELNNPLLQLNRTASLLRQLLLSLGLNTPIEANVVFTHPAFTLYQAPLDSPIIFPNQITNHLRMINNQATKLTNKSERIAAKLLQLNKTESPHQRLPSFRYEELQKGIICPACRMFSMVSGRGICKCESCGHKESVTTTVLRQVEEFQLLFPERKLTTREIYKWCGEVLSKKVIWRILSNNFKSVGEYKSRYYK